MGSLDHLIYAGNINTTLSQNERKGDSQVHDLGREFMADLIVVVEPIDVKPNGGNITWRNKMVGPNHITTRLESFLIGSSLLVCYFSLSSCILPWYGFDHPPISLTLSPYGNLGPISLC